MIAKWSISGEERTSRRMTENDVRDPMYGPAVLAREFDEAAVSGLASMYPASSWSVVLRAIMDISAHAISLADRPQADH